MFAIFWPSIAIPPGRLIHMAPEPHVGDFLRQGRTVFTMDLEAESVDLHADVESLPVPDRSVAAVVCFDVLEHVESDARALREIERVLVDGGVAILHVPVVATETVEYGFAHEADHGHRRTYGPDVVDRARAAGLQVEVWSNASLSRRQRFVYGLSRKDGLIVGRRRRP